MPLFDVELTHADDTAVLAAYVAAEEAAKAESSDEQPAEADDHPASAIDPATEDCESPGPKIRRQTWVRRLRDVDGIPGDRMAPIHGRLIAHGLLQFQLQGQNEGVLYRVTSAGRKSLSAAVDKDAADSQPLSEPASQARNEAA